MRIVTPLFLLAVVSVGLPACGSDDTNSDPRDTSSDTSADTSGIEDSTDDTGSDTTDTGSGIDADVDSDIGTDVGTDVVVPPFEWPVPMVPVDVTPHEHWRSTVQFGCDENGCEPFLASTIQFDVPEPRWIKFVVPMSAPEDIYFQNSVAYPFHSPFVAERLDPWMHLAATAPESIDAISLHEEGQELIFGAVVFAPGMQPAELGIQLVRQDAYHPEMAIRIMDTVRQGITTTAAIGGSQNLDFYYFPTFAQQQSAQTWRSLYADAGYPVSDVARWQQTDQCYTQGWNHGVLKKVAAADLDDAYGTDLLGPDDIVLLDAVPAEIPQVRGIISTSAASPNSHVALLAASYGVPFVYLADDSSIARAEALVGQHIVLRADSSVWNGPCVNFDSSADPTDPAVVAALTDLRPELTVDYVARSSAGVIGVNVDSLSPTSIGQFGGKASNYGFLRQAIGDNVRSGVALSFDAWDAFMGQPTPGGASLGGWISDQLSDLTWPADIVALRIRLGEIREAIKDAPYPSSLESDLLAALSDFDATRKIRFRSSTNVEDGVGFTGAGLYDSYSGCLADDQDSDGAGPSLCDSNRAKERGVLRAIRKVYASFYNDNAYFERRRRGVVEAEVGMAILAHHSFPDELELANGVTTYQYSGSNGQRAQMVTQLGATSVANPDGSAVAEVVDVNLYNFGIYVDLKTVSSLVPLGGFVMENPDDYEGFAELFRAVAEAWAETAAGQGAFGLDFEYKKIDPAGSGEEPLVVKQVRPLPAKAAPTDAAYVVGGEPELCTLQGESGDGAFATHRLRSKWKMKQASGALPMAGGTLNETLYSHFDVSFSHGSGQTTVNGAPASLPNYGFSFDTDRTIDRFEVPLGELAIETALNEGYYGVMPIMFSGEMRRYVRGYWSTPQPAVTWSGDLSRTEEVVVLVPCSDLEPKPNDQAVGRTWVWTPDGDGDANHPDAVVFELEFVWPGGPTGVSAGYTAPLKYWTSVTITGLLDEPVVLTDNWAMSYRPGHHNFTESVVIEPTLDPSLSSTQKEALEALDIRLIHIDGAGGFQATHNAAPGVVRVVGANNNLRNFDSQ